MKTINVVIRSLLGLGLLAFGFNKFFAFLPPPKLPEAADAAMSGLLSTNYILPDLVGITEILVGFLLLTGLFVPLALVLLAPLSVNLLLFHLALAPDPEAALPAYVVFGMNLYLLFAYLDSYKPLLRMKA